MTITDGIILAGHVGVDSGQIMIGDPCYIEDWDTNQNDEWNLEGKEGDYSYHGASATTLAHNFGTLGMHSAVIMSSGYGDGLYPVYVKTNDDGRVVMAIIDFNDELDRDEE